MNSVGFRIGFPVDVGNDEDWWFVLVKSSTQPSTFGRLGAERAMEEPPDGRGAERAAKHFPQEQLSKRFLHFSSVARRQDDPTKLWPEGDSDTAACCLAYVQNSVNSSAPIILVSCNCSLPERDCYNGTELLPVTGDSRTGVISLKRKWRCVTESKHPIAALVLVQRDADALRDIGVPVELFTTRIFSTVSPERPAVVSVNPIAMHSLAIALGLGGEYFERFPGRQPTAVTDEFRADAAKTSVTVVTAPSVNRIQTPKIISAPLTSPRVTAAGDANDRGNALSHPEIEILRRIAEGHSNNDTAVLLGLTASEVIDSVVRIYQKLGVGNRAEAAAEGVRRGIVDFSDWDEETPSGRSTGSAGSRSTQYRDREMTQMLDIAPPLLRARHNELRKRPGQDPKSPNRASQRKAPNDTLSPSSSEMSLVGRRTIIPSDPADRAPAPVSHSPEVPSSIVPPWFVIVFCFVVIIICSAKLLDLLG